jgi:uncharacterized MAPEG superfamily protein
MVMPFVFSSVCVLVMACLPIVCAGIAKSGKFQQPLEEGGYDNQLPRAWLSQLHGWRARAHAAQQNTFEALPFFFVALVLAHLASAPLFWINLLAGVFTALRVLYVALYVQNLANARSLVWVLAFLVNAALLTAALWAT